MVLEENSNSCFFKIVTTSLSCGEATNGTTESAVVSTVETSSGNTITSY